MSDVSLGDAEGEGLRRPYSTYEMPSFHIRGHHIY